MAATLLPQGRQRYFDDNGLPLAGGLIYTFAAGTSTPQAAFQDADGTVPHTNPIVLDAKGEAVIFWNGNYKVNVKTSGGVQVSGWPVDNMRTDSLGFMAALSSFIASLASSIGSTLIGVTLGVVGAVLRTVASKLGDVVSVKDFGAKGDGVTDDTAAIQAAIDAFTQRYTAYPKHDMYSRGTLKGSTLARVFIYFPPGEYRVSSTLDITYRGFLHFFGYGAVIHAKLGGVSSSTPMIDMRYTNESSWHGFVFETADVGAIRFLHTVSLGGSDNKVADSTIAAKAVHFIDCEFRNPSDTSLNAMNDTGTFKAGLDNSSITNCFFAGGAVGIKHSGAESWVTNCNFASQTFAGAVMYDNASMSFVNSHWTLANAAPAILSDTDNNFDSLRFLSCYWEQCTYVLQALGTASNKKANILVEGGRIESQQSGIMALVNRHCVVTLKDVHIGNTNANTAITCGNTFSTLVVEQNQIDQDFGGAMLNLASWSGKLHRFGFLAGNPVNVGPSGSVTIYVDPLAGNDFNEGYSSNRALQTIGEAFKRVNSGGSSAIMLASGTDATPQTYTMPAGMQQFSGRVLLGVWEKNPGQINALNQRTKLDCSTNKYELWVGWLAIQNLELLGTRAITMFSGKLDLQSVRVAVSDAVNGHVFINSGDMSSQNCAFTGTSGIMFYVGNQFGVQATLFGNGNSWGAGITKYQAFSGITALILQNL